MRRSLAGLVVMALILFVSGCTRSAEGTLESFLNAAAGVEADRGWHYLDQGTREFAYANDLEAYLRDAGAASWGAFEWSEASTVWTDDGFASVMVELQSDPRQVPAFLIRNGLLNGVCLGGTQPLGLGAFVDVRPLGDGTLEAGGLSGSQMRCNSRFIGADAYDQ